MQTVLVDTDVAIDFLRGVPYSKELLKGLWERSLAYLSVLSVYELVAGLREKERAATEHFIQAFNLEAVDDQVARRAGEFFRMYRQKGLTLTLVDCLLMATALERKHKIASRNISHFPEKGLLLKIPSVS
jgi:predicted nucleic acid-binding protein